MVVTNNEKLAGRIKVLGLHGMSRDAWRRYSSSGYAHYAVVAPGFKYNLTDIASSIGIEQLKKIEGFRKRREELWTYFNDQFQDLPVTLPAAIPGDIVHAMHLYTILVDRKRASLSRNEFLNAFHLNGIGCGVHFNPVHLHDYYRKKYGYRKGDFPESEYIGERTVSLPFSPLLTQTEIQRIAKTVRKILKH